MASFLRKKANAVLDHLTRKGVIAQLVGSVGRGDFRPGSDIDILVTEYPKHLKYRLEADIEDLLGATPFDLVYADELPPHILSWMLTGKSKANVGER